MLGSDTDSRVRTNASCSVSVFQGSYKSEENQLLLKVYQVKGPTEHYYSKFKNDNWAMDGYVRKSSSSIILQFSDMFTSAVKMLLLMTIIHYI